jgi:hypothetical protein
MTMAFEKERHPSSGGAQICKSAQQGALRSGSDAAGGVFLTLEYLKKGQKFLSVWGAGAGSVGGSGQGHVQEQEYARPDSHTRAGAEAGRTAPVALQQDRL